MKSTQAHTGWGGTPGRPHLPGPPLVLLALLTLTATACNDGGPGDGPDAGMRRDATIVDAPMGDGGPDGGVARDGGSAPDAAGASCSSGVCDPRADGECGARDYCVFIGGVPTCASDVGTAEPGEACMTSQECAAGLACFQRLGRGVCARVCCPGDDTACATPTRCVGSAALVDGSSTDWWHCVGPRPCDPLDPAEVCEAEEGCYIIAVDGATDCRRAGDGAAGDPCGEQNDCAPGLFCGGVTERTCSRICRLGDAGPGDCPSGEGVCVAYSHSPAGTGICTPATAMSVR